MFFLPCKYLKKTPRNKERRGEELLEQITTRELIEELSKREGVEVKRAEPYQDMEVTVNGPAVVIVVTD